MPFTVRLKDRIGSFIVIEGETILDAALRQDYFIPYSCHEGICGTCEGTVLEGIVTYYHADSLTLEPDELASGQALFCSATPRSDLIIDAPGIRLPANDNLSQFQYQLLNLQALNDQVFEATLMPTEITMAYLAGQYLEVLLPDEEPRPFSIANAPLGDGQIQLHLRYQSDNPYAVKLIDHLRTHQRLDFRGAKGHCLYHPVPSMPTIMIAGGTGFAPLKAIIEQALSEPLSQPLTLYWTAKNFDDLYLHELALQWDRYVPHFRYVPVLTGHTIPTSWTGKTGSVYKVIQQEQINLRDHHAYISGPPSLTLDAFEHLADLGLQHYYLYSDAIDYL